MSTAIVVATMASMGFEPKLDAVSAEGGAEVGRAFVSGLHKVFIVMGSLMVLGMVLSILKGDRPVELRVSTGQRPVDETPAS